MPYRVRTHPLAINCLNAFKNHNWRCTTIYHIYFYIIILYYIFLFLYLQYSALLSCMPPKFKLLGLFVPRIFKNLEYVQTLPTKLLF